MEHNWDSVGWHDHQTSLQEHDELYRVAVLHFSRSPPELKEVLESSDELQAVQRQLQQAGHSWTLPSEAKVLLLPKVYRALLRHLTSKPVASVAAAGTVEQLRDRERCCQLVLLCLVHRGGFSWIWWNVVSRRKTHSN